jgi:hypothetical protein
MLAAVKTRPTCGPRRLARSRPRQVSAVPEPVTMLTESRHCRIDLPVLCVAQLLVTLAGPACGERNDEPTQPPPAHLPPPSVKVAPRAAESAPAEAANTPSNVVRTGDASVAGQLLKGFYAIEAGSWRWTDQAFSVKLAVPPEAAEKGGVLRIDFVLPEALVDQHPNVTLKATVDGSETSKTFSGAGNHRLELELPAAALSGGVVLAEFAVDRPFLPGGLDRRSLGIVARSFELVTK